MTTDETRLEEVVVTAEKRSENVQTVPIAITAINQDTLTQKGVTQIGDLAEFVPNLYIFMGNGQGVPEFTLRGIGSGSFNKNTNSTVAVYLDEFVLDTNTTQSGQLFDLERVEVLNGPQGTLYGKNSTGGAINFITRKPDGTTEADGATTVGRFGEFDFEGGAQTAITDNLSVRVAVNRNYSDGYGFNVTTDRRTERSDDWGARLGMRLKTDNLDAFWKLYTDELNAAQQDVQISGINFNGSPRADNSNPITGFIPPAQMDVFAGTGNGIRTRNFGSGLNISYNFGYLTLTSITGWVHSVSKVFEDTDESPFNVANVPNSDISTNEVTQEFRLSSSSADVLSWIAGVNFFHKTLHDYDGYDLSALGVPLITDNFYEKNTSYAGFVDGTLKLGGGVSLIAGVRETHDKKEQHYVSPFSFAGPFNVSDSRSWTDPTYRGVLNYQMDENTLLYASYSHGYRSGAYNSGFISNPIQLTPVNPEFVNNYEGGIKTTVFDQRLRLASAFYYMIFKDMQLDALATATGSVCCSTINAGKARIYGLELQATALLTDNFDVQFSGTDSKGEFTQFTNGTKNYNGTRLGRLPTYKVRVSPEYRVPVQGGKFFFAPDANFIGTTRVTTTPDPYGRDVQKPYVILDGQFGYRANAGYSVFAWIKNATDKRYLTLVDVEGGLGYLQREYSAPRTFGITVTARY